jgi:hypothetical protein
MAEPSIIKPTSKLVTPINPGASGNGVNTDPDDTEAQLASSASPVATLAAPEAEAHEAEAVDQTPSGDDADIRELWTDDGLNDPLTTERYHKVPIGKSKSFFRTHPDKKYRRKCEILVLKSENSIGEEYYLIGPKMKGKIDEARPCTLVTVVDRLGYPRLWPLLEPRDGENDNDAWISARAAARQGLEKWIKILWKGRAFVTREAEKGYAPNPDWSKLPPFSELIRTAFGEHGVIRDESHAVYRQLFGKSATTDADSDDPLS